MPSFSKDDRYSVALEALKIYKKGENIIGTLSRKYPGNITDIISLAYDIQSGTYTNIFNSDEYAISNNEVKHWTELVLEETKSHSVLDCGIGEATSWILHDTGIESFYATDISMNRLQIASKNIAKKNNIDLKSLFRADLHHIPLSDDSVDLVVTMHAIEPNHGSEDTLLNELIRVASGYIFVMEPDFSTADEAMKERMTKNKYATEIFPCLTERADLEIIHYERLKHPMNELNWTSVLLAKKVDRKQSEFGFVSPVSGKKLVNRDGYLIEEDGYFAYPSIDGIYALLRDDGIAMFDRPERFNVVK